MKRVGHLWETLVSEENLNRAVDAVNRSHRWKPHHRWNRCTAWVEATRGERIAELRAILQEGFAPAPPHELRRYDASCQKWRDIAVPRQWPDQYIHHALIQVLEPVFLRGMDTYCCGSIRGRGTHYGVRAVRRWMDRDARGTKYCLALDIRKFYQSLRPAVVLDRMRQRIKDARVLDLLERVLRDGVPIGYYTSQWFANVVLQPLDALIRAQDGVKHYVRYMDNMTLFGANKRKLRRVKAVVEQWLAERGLRVKGDWQLFPTRARLPDAMGYRYGHGYCVPRKRTLLRLRRQIARWRRGGHCVRRARGLLSRVGVLRHCSNHGLYSRLLYKPRLAREWKRAVKEAG